MKERARNSVCEVSKGRNTQLFVLFSSMRFTWHRWSCWRLSWRSRVEQFYWAAPFIRAVFNQSSGCLQAKLDASTMQTFDIDKCVRVGESVREVRRCKAVVRRRRRLVDSSSSVSYFFYYTIVLPLKC